MGNLYTKGEICVLPNTLLGFLFADHMPEGNLSRADDFPYAVSRMDIELGLMV